MLAGVIADISSCDIAAFWRRCDLVWDFWDLRKEATAVIAERKTVSFPSSAMLTDSSAPRKSASALEREVDIW